MSDHAPVLAVCHNTRNLELLTQFLQREGYPAMRAATLPELDEALEEPSGLSLALIDLSGFDAQIWQRCDRLHRDGIPFLLISAGRSRALRKEGLRRGARDVLGKPLAMQELSALIEGLARRPGQG